MVAVTVVDSNVWIFLNLDVAPEHVAAVEQIERHRAGELQLNVIIVSEVLHKLQMLINPDSARLRVNKMLTSDSVVYEPLSRQVIDRAIVLTRKARIRINDALIAAHALESRQAVLTDDIKDFRRVPGLEVIPLRRNDRA